MADNTTLNAGTGGDVVASDDIGGVKFQRVKVVLGADGVNDGDVAAGNRLPVGLDSGTVAGGASLPAGTNNIGDVDVVTLPNVTLAAGTNNIGDVDVLSLPATPTGDNRIGRVKLTDDTLVAGLVDETGASAVDALAVGGGTPHDSVDSGNPIKVGARAVAHGANPAAVAAADRSHLVCNRHGVPFVIGGHPNTISGSVRISDATGAQTDAAVIAGTIAAGTKVAVTAITATCSRANTVNVAVKIGFGTANVPADSTTGASGVLLDHDGIAPGSGVSVGNGAGILGVGGDGEEVRLTCDDPVGGSVIVTMSYFTIES